MDWMNVLEGAASLDVFPKTRSIAEALQDMNRAIAQRVTAENISEGEALTCIHREYMLGNYLCFLACLVSFALILATAATTHLEAVTVPIGLTFPAALLGPKVAYALLKRT